MRNQKGVYFNEQTVSSITQAVTYFENNLELFNPGDIAKHASQFSTERFRKELSNYFSKAMSQSK